MTTYDILTIAAFVLAIVSIWLSLYFYRQSNRISDAIINNLTDLKILTNKIEGFYNRIYEDTFSILRKNYEATDNNRLTYIESQIKTKMIGEIEELMKLELSKHININNLSNNDSIKQIAENVSQKATEIENKVKEETYLSEIMNIINYLSTDKESLILDNIVNEANSKGFEFREVIKELIKLKDKGLIIFQEPINAITIITKK